MTDGIKLEVEDPNALLNNLEKANQVWAEIMSDYRDGNASEEQGEAAITHLEQIDRLRQQVEEKREGE